jgi:hypothetical protein
MPDSPNTPERSSTVEAALAIAEALFSTNGEPPPADRLAWLAGELGDFLERAGSRSRGLLGVTIWAVTFLAPLMIGRFERLGALALRDRERALSRLEKSFGEPLLAVKALLCLLYYEHPDAARGIGFDGHCLRRGTRTSLDVVSP